MITITFCLILLKYNYVCLYLLVLQSFKNIFRWTLGLFVCALLGSLRICAMPARWSPCEVSSEEWVQRFILIMCHYPDPGSASDWLKQVSLTARLIRITTQIQVVTHHQYRRFVLVPETSFHRGSRGGIAKYWLFFSANMAKTSKYVFYLICIFYIHLLGLVCNTKKYWHEYYF